MVSRRLSGARPHSVHGELGFCGDRIGRPRFHANDQSRDELDIRNMPVEIEDARAFAESPHLDVEGFTLRRHVSAVTDFRDTAAIDRMHREEIRGLLLELTGADHIAVTSPGVLRFSERSPDSGALNNSRPARFVHIDCSDRTAADFYRQSAPDDGRGIRRSAQYNVWRVMTPPPQDVPLAVCDARTLAGEDLVPADAVFDRDGAVLFSFEALLVRYNPNQRWCFYSDMRPDEVLVFKTNDTDPAAAHQVAHGAFSDASSPKEAPPRASIEMRGIAYWFE